MLRNTLQTAFLTLALAVPATAFAQEAPGNFGELESAIYHSGSDAAAVSRLHNVPSVGVVNLMGISPFSHMGMDIGDVEIYAENNAAGVARLRHALAANPATSHALHDHGVNIAKVVGVQIGSSGSLRVYED